MPFFLITVMTLSAIVAFAWIIAGSQHTNLYSLRNLFLAVWLYYGFSVGIDLLTGAEIPYTVGEAHMMNPSNWDSVAFVMWCYALCGIAFVTTYAVMQGKDKIVPVELRYDLRTPPSWALILIHLIAGWIYIEWFMGLDRMARIAMSQQYASYKFATLVVPITLAMDLLVVLSAKDRRAGLAVALAFVLSLLTGNRSYLMFFVLVAAFRWRPSLRGWKLVGMLASCAFMVFAFKTLYAVGFAWYQGIRVDADMVYDNLHMTLCGLDADASYSIAIFYTSHDSPLWLGKSYLQTPLLVAWPRFLGGFDVSTLAEDYVWKYHTRTAERGGALAFSAIAEAWLNFSYAGPAILGAAWGALANYFDRRPRGVAYFILLMMMARLFRSDTASLFKNWVLVWGTMFAIAIACLTVYTVLIDTNRRRLAAGAGMSGPGNQVGNRLGEV